MKPTLALLMAVGLAWASSDALAVDQSKEKKVTREILRDENGHQIGSVKRENGVEKVYDKNHHYQGQYRESDNITRDREGHKVGTGNQNNRGLSK